MAQDPINLKLADVSRLLNEAGWEGGELEELTRGDGLTTWTHHYREWESPSRHDDYGDTTFVCFIADDNDPSVGEVSCSDHYFGAGGPVASVEINSLEALRRLIQDGLL